MALIIGHRYRVKTREELVASGWEEYGGGFNHPDSAQPIVDAMLRQSGRIVTAIGIAGNISRQKQVHISAEAGDYRYCWTEQMLIPIATTKRQLPEWF